MVNNQSFHTDNFAIAQYAGGEPRGIYKNEELGDSYLFVFPKGSIVPNNLYLVQSTGTMKYHSSYDWLMPIVKKLVKDELCHPDDFVEHLFDIEQLYIFVVETIINDR